MPELILVRHASPEIDPARPAAEWPLSEEGRERCRQLADRLKVWRPARVFSSVEPKAWETAAVVAQRLGVPCEGWPDLHEHDRSGVPFAGAAGFEQSMARLFAQPTELVFGNETARQAEERFAAAVEAALAKHRSLAPDRSAAIVSHGTVISLLLARWTGTEPLPLWRRLGLPAFAVVALPERRLLEVVDQVV